jgi:hypothetical protein
MAKTNEQDIVCYNIPTSYTRNTVFLSITCFVLVRWGGVKKYAGTYRWSLTQEELTTWDVNMASLFSSCHIPWSMNGGHETNIDVLHHLSSLVLFRMAKERLQQPTGLMRKNAL